MKQIYRDSFAFFLSALPALLAFAAMIEVLLWVLQPRSESAVTFAALAIVAYYFHRHFLFGESMTLAEMFKRPQPAPGAPPIKMGWFLALSFLVLFVPIGLALVVSLASFRGDQMLGAYLLIVFPLYLLTLSLFGTALPATVARDGTWRVAQGLRATFETMWRLLAGPALVGLAVLVLIYFADRAIAGFGLAEDSPLLLVWFIVIRTLGFLSTILAVAVLCEMYRRTRPAPAMAA
jgi:hypothetical protein